MKSSNFKLYWTDAGRKRKYLAMDTKEGVVPAIYFRKSKWITDEQFTILMKYIKETL